MDVVLKASQVLNLIFDEDVFFADALKRSLEDVPRTKLESSSVRRLVNGALRHQLVIFAFLDKHLVNPLSKSTQMYLLAYFAEVIFVQQLEEDGREESLNAFLESDETTLITSNEIKTLQEIGKRSNQLLPDDLEQTSNEYLALQYNTPAWLIKMWRKMLGEKILIKFLIANQRPSFASFKLNNHLISIDDLLAGEPKFKKGPAKNTVIYQSKQPFSKLKAYQNGYLYPQRLAVSQVLEELKLKNVRNCLIYDAHPNSLYLDLAQRLKGKIKIDLAVPQKNHTFKIEQILKKANLHNVYVFDAQPGSIITAVRDQKDLVIVAPDSSKFDLIRDVPDFIAHLKQSELDTYIENSRTALEECANFLRVGGDLLYLSNTCSNKEGHALIVEFLTKHPNFRLIREKQFLPFDKYDSTLYYALLTRKEDEDA